MLDALLTVLSFGSHYLLCAALLFLCCTSKKNGLFPLCAAATILMVLVSAVGFYLLYAGLFLPSGKTFAMYVSRYAPYTLPVFLFPLVGFVMTLRCRKQ